MRDDEFDTVELVSSLRDQWHMATTSSNDYQNSIKEMAPHIYIRGDEDGECVVSDDVVLPFRKIMRRDPNPNRPLEKDFVFSKENLQEVYKMVVNMPCL